MKQEKKTDQEQEQEQKEKQGENTPEQLLKLIVPLLTPVLAHEIDVWLLSHSTIIQTLMERTIIAKYKADICYELLSEEQREKARQLLQERYTRENRKWKPIEEWSEDFNIRL